MNRRPAAAHTPLQAELWRSDIIEAVHLASFAAVDSNGSLLAAAGDPRMVTTLRSAAKPLQALPLTTLAGADSLDLRDEELAVCCASHPGTPRHAALAASVLALSGYLPDDLVCGPAGDLASPLLHGCSGNHAAILLIAHLLGAHLAGYENPGHPAQQLIAGTIRELSGAGDMELAMDGCGIPTFGLRLSEMARAFARLTEPETPWSRIPAVMGAHPDIIGAEGWIDGNLMQATRGRLIAKTGAEGLLCVGVRNSGQGLAIKVHDGSTRALGLLGLEALRLARWIGDEELAHPSLVAHRKPVLTASTGVAAARLRLLITQRDR